MLVVSLTACALPAEPPPLKTTAEDPTVRAVAWAEVTTRAVQQPGYAGFERTPERLFIGYNSDPERKLAEITKRPDVGAFLAPRTLAEMKSALARAGDMLSKLNVPYVGLDIDYRAGAIFASDVGNAIKENSFYCDQLVALPSRVEGTNIPFVDRRQCDKR